MRELDELAAGFASASAFPAADLVRLTATARANGCRWAIVAEARSAGSSVERSELATDLFRTAQHAAGTVGGRFRVAPVTWPCGACGQEIRDLAPSGWPVHFELGHKAGCTRLARDRAADDADRRARIPRPVVALPRSQGRL